MSKNKGNKAATADDFEKPSKFREAKLKRKRLNEQTVRRAEKRRAAKKVAEKSKRKNRR